MKKICIAIVILMLGVNVSMGEDKATDEKMKLGVQTYSFRYFTLMEALDMAHEAGIKYIEAYPGQKFSPEKKDVKVGPDLSPELRKELKAKLKANGQVLVHFGVVQLPNDEKKCRKVFDFAKDMGIQVIVSEPEQVALPLIDKLCNEYGIRLAIHNHAIPTRYWDPEIVLKALEGRSAMMGFCGDTGHWTRSGINAVEVIKKCKGRLICFHLKDMNRSGTQLEKHNGKDVERAHEVPFGQGVSDVEGILTELHAQEFEGVIAIEYEHNHRNPLPDVKECVSYFNSIVEKLKADKK